MTQFFWLLLGVCGVIVFGMGIVNNLRLQIGWLEKLALSYLLGMGFFTIILFFTNWFGRVPLTPVLSWFVLGISSGVSWSFVPLTKHFFVQQKLFEEKDFFQDKRHFKWLLLALVVLIATLSLWATLNTPVKDWDSIVLYDYRAQVAFKTGYLDSAIDKTTFFGYPLMTTIAHIWVYVQGYPFPGVVHWLWYISIVIIFFSRLRADIGKTQALFWVPIFMISGHLFNNSLMTYTNLAYTVYLLSGWFYLFAWLKKPHFFLMLLACLMVGLSTWARSSDPFWLLFIITAVCGIAIRKKWIQASLITLILVIRYLWVGLQTYYLNQFEIVTEGVSTYTFSPLLLLDVTRIVSVASYFFQFVILPEKYYFSFLFVITLLFLFHRKLFQDWASWGPLIAIASSVAVAFLGILKFSVSYDDWMNIGGSATRMMIFVIPLIIYFGALVLARIWRFWK